MESPAARPVGRPRRVQSSAGAGVLEIRLVDNHGGSGSAPEQRHRGTVDPLEFLPGRMEIGPGTPLPLGWRYGICRIDDGKGIAAVASVGSEVEPPPGRGPGAIALEFRPKAPRGAEFGVCTQEATPSLIPGLRQLVRMNLRQRGRQARRRPGGL